MSDFLDRHKLVHRQDQIEDVEAERDLEPRLLVTTVGLSVIDRDREEHHEDGHTAPHDLEEPDAFSLHLLLPALHPEILHAGALHFHLVLPGVHLGTPAY